MSTTTTTEASVTPVSLPRATCPACGSMTAILPGGDLHAPCGRHAPLTQRRRQRPRDAEAEL